MANASPPSCRIERFIFGVRRSPLSEPYKLSFSTIENFDSVWVFIEDEFGRTGIGEAVPLPGYSSETVQDVLGCMGEIARGKQWRATDSLRQYSHSIKDKYPFSASAVITAMELPYWLEKKIPLEPIPLIYPLASILDSAQLKTTLDKALSGGYIYFKLKVGDGFKK